MTIAKNILVVDDDEEVSELVVEILTNSDFGDVTLEIDTAGDGQTAFERISSDKYDLIIIDIKMPGMDGIEVIKSVRQQNIANKVPFIVLSGFIGEVDLPEGDNGENVFYLTKPFDSQELRSTVKMWVSSSVDI